ncbi:MAG: translocation/assembly module TamB domain-containing protein [Bacteroidota bacterium]
MSRFFRIGLKTLAIIAGFLILLIIFINLPFSKNFVTRQVNQLFTKLELPLSINSINSVRLKSVHVEGFSIIDPGGDTIIYAGKVKANYNLLALARSRVKLKDARIDQASVKLLMNKETKLLTIAEAFKKKEKKKSVDPEKKKSDWEISIKNIDLTSVHFLMADSVGGTHIHQEVEDVKIKKFRLSLLERELMAHALELRQAAGEITLAPPPSGEMTGGNPKKQKTQQNPSKGHPWNFGVKKLSLQDIDFSYEKRRDSLMLVLNLDKGVISTNLLDFYQKIIDVDEISIDGLQTGMYTGRGSNEEEASRKGGISDFPWDIKTRKVKLNNIAVKTGTFDLHRPDLSTPGLAMEDLEMRLDKLRLSMAEVSMDLRKLSFQLNNGFSLEKMEAELNSESGSTNLNLALASGNSRLGIECTAREGFFAILGDPPGIPAASLNLHHSMVSLKDVASFKPEIREAPAYPVISDKPVGIALQMNKKNSTIHLDDLSLSQHQNFLLSLKGTAENSFDSLNALGNLDLELSEINIPWLKKVLSASGFETTVPDSMELELLARISDTLRSPDIEIELFSKQGNINLAGKLDLKRKSYRFVSEFGHVHLGEILANPVLGSFTGSAAVAGSGFSMKHIESEAKLQIDSLWFKGYNYTQTCIEGVIRPDEYELQLLAEDPSLNAKLDLLLVKSDSGFRAEADGNLFAQLDHLHFYKDTLAVESKLQASFIKASDRMESNMHLEEISLYTPGEKVELELFKAAFHTDSIRTDLSTEGDFLAMDVHLGKNIYELDSLGQDYKKYLQSFIDPANPDGTIRVSFLPEINAMGYIGYHKAMALFIKDPEFSFSRIDMALTNRTSENHIDYVLKARKIKTTSLETESLDVMLTDSAGFLNLAVRADSTSLFSGPRNHIHLRSRFAQRQSENELIIYDSLQQTTYSLDISSRVDSNWMTLSAPSQQFIINRKSWQLESPELLGMDLNTKTLYPELNMQADSSQLHLKQTRFSDLEFNDISIDGFFAFSDSGEYALDLSARLDSSGIEMQGKNTASSPRNLKATFSKLPLNTIEPFVAEHISNLGGNISGELDIATIEGKEHYNGRLVFDDALLRVNSLNSSFRVPGQQIQLAHEKLLFNEFTVLDSLNNSLLVDGYIDLSNTDKLMSDLNISSSGLQVMNKEASRDASLYGNIFVDSRIKVKGPFTNPTVDGHILLSSGTEIYYQHQEDLRVTESAKYVNFVNYDDEGEQITTTTLSRNPTFSNSSIKTMVEIDPSTVLNFDLEKRIYEIELRIKGGGILNYSMLNQNQFSLSGTYNIGEGVCDLRLVGWPNKTFEIADGAYVRWDGNMENPELNLRAVNKVASSYQNPLDGKQRNVDFNVILQLSQHLSDLDIVLTFDTPDQYLMSIINTLSPEDHMRQAITILLFETVDLPGISTTSDYMTQQVNQILAAQLNQLTQSTIKGVDISLGLDSYEQLTPSGGTETTTSLSYEVSKSLMNDRAQIEVSGRLTDTNELPGSSDMSYNNISFEYRLDSAATKYLKVYNEHSYEDVFEGEVVRTGVGITFRKRYRHIRDIWRRKDKNAGSKKTGR